jgi:hypothetical protein
LLTFENGRTSRRRGRRDKVKVKVVPVLFLTEHHTKKAYWGNVGIATRILDLGTT